jgi:hypothetical protein
MSASDASSQNGRSAPPIRARIDFIFTTLAAEKMVIALVEGNDLAHVLGSRRPSPVHAAGVWHLSKISIMQLIEIKRPPVLLAWRESAISIR